MGLGSGCGASWEGVLGFGEPSGEARLGLHAAIVEPAV